MDLELVKFINSDLTWSAVKKGHRSTPRRPRKAKASGSAFGIYSGSKARDSVVSDYEKTGVAILGQHFAEEVLEVPIKKRILLLQSPGQMARSPQPKTPSPCHEAIKQTEKAVPYLNDFSGIELLAAAACHSSGHVESSAVEEHSTPRVESCLVGIKHDISPMESVDSSVQDKTFPVTQNRCDNGNDEGDKSSVPTKVVRLHWDLNTVMEEWEEPCDILVDARNDDLQNEPRKAQVTGGEQGRLLSGEPDINGTRVNSDGGYLGATCDAESCPSKSDVVDSFTNPGKCENIYTPIASVSLEETTTKVESDDKQAVSEVVQGGCLSLKGNTDDKFTSEDHLSDCCGSNVSQDKVKSGYDSPAEDGELREPARHTWEKEESEELECVDYESDDMYEDNSDAIESVTNEIVVDHPQTMKASVSVPNNDTEQGSDKADALGSKHSQSVIFEEKGSSSKKFLPERKHMPCIERPTTTSSCIRRSRSERDFGQEKFMGREGSSYHTGQWVDSFSRNRRGLVRYPRQNNVRSGGSSCIDNNEAINYNPRGNYRNESYGGIHGGMPPSRDISRGRSRVGLIRAPQEDYNNPDPLYSERKVASFASNFNRGANPSRSQKQSRSRSRSGSPIAWHFQKKRNVETKRQSPDYKSDTRFPSRKLIETEAGLVSQTTGRVSLQCVSRSFDDRNVINEQYRDRRSSPVFNRTHQRADPSGYVGRLKSNDHFRPRFPLSGNNSIIHDDKYGMVNERRRFRDDDESFKGYSRNKDSGFRYTRIENKGFRDPKNTSEEKGCRYTTNKMFNTGEGHFYKDN